jgi:hypothetical protein
MSFFRAMNTATMHGLNSASRRPDMPAASTVTWRDAAIGVAILILVQAMLFAWTFVEMGAFYIEILRDLGLVTALAFALPFLVFFIVARLASATEKLPAVFLYLALLLAFFQLLSAAFQQFNIRSSVGLGMMAVAIAYAAKGFFGIGWLGALALALLVTAGTVGAGLLLLLLPTGRAMMG